MKICHINLAREFGGSERQTELLIRALAPKPVRQILLTHPSSPLLTRLADINNLEFRPARGPGLLRFSKCQHCDILHAHEINGALLAYIAHKRYRIPFALSSRYFSPPEKHPLAKAIFSNVDLVFARSRRIEQILRQWKPDLAIRTIPTMCAHLKITESFREINARYAGKFVIGASDCHSGKTDSGLFTWIEAARQLSARHPDMRFVIIGADRTERAVGQLTEGLPIDILAPKRNLGDYLNCLDLYVATSSHHTIQTLLVDAMEQEIPIIATDFEDARSLIQDQINGALVPSGSAGALVREIERIYLDADLRQRLVVESRHRVQQHFPELLCERYYESYQDLLPR
ncbi:MAG TPA: glycosyltransferase [Gammaproteobacteria bacterium]|nr:glycosyltransferase [Gammaproteobacteria bacterium]